jgi:hypothetical protein
MYAPGVMRPGRRHPFGARHVKEADIRETGIACERLVAARATSTVPESATTGVSCQEPRKAPAGLRIPVNFH